MANRRNLSKGHYSIFSHGLVSIREISEYTGHPCQLSVIDKTEKSEIKTRRVRLVYVLFFSKDLNRVRCELCWI